MAAHKKGDRALGPELQADGTYSYRYPKMTPGQPVIYPGWFEVKWYNADPSKKPKKRTYQFKTAAHEAAQLALAQRYVARINEEAQLAAGVTVEDGMAAYPEWLRRPSPVDRQRAAEDPVMARLAKRKKSGELAIATVMGQLDNLFPTTMRGLALGDIDGPYCGKLWKALGEIPVRGGGAPTVDTQLNTWEAGRRFLDFCVLRKWVRSNPFVLFAPDLGRSDRNKGGKGKKQLGFDDLAKWQAKAYELVDDDDEGAIAGLIALQIGIRVTQIVRIQAKDIDMGGCVIYVDHRTATKSTRRVNYVKSEKLSRAILRLKGPKIGTEWIFASTGKVGAGKRQFSIEERSRIMAEYAAAPRGKGLSVLAKYGVKTTHIVQWRRRDGKVPLPGGHRNRGWVAEQIKRICRLAGVPEDTHAHGMRGASATLDSISGQVMREIQERLSHRLDSPVTDDCYVADGAKSLGRQGKLEMLSRMRVLPGGKEE